MPQSQVTSTNPDGLRITDLSCDRRRSSPLHQRYPQMFSDVATVFTYCTTDSKSDEGQEEELAKEPNEWSERSPQHIPQITPLQTDSYLAKQQNITTGINCRIVPGPEKKNE